MKSLRTALLAAALAAASGAHAQLIGPSGGTGLSGEYARASDSPFAATPFSWFHLENFEDHLFNTPGVSASAGGVTSVVFGPQIHDSVDTDDGAFDGSGLLGDDYFSGSGSTGIVFTFSAAVLGALPTHAGLVWTDGVDPINFEAFDQNGVSLGGIFDQHHADGSFAGTLEDDRFYGLTHLGGISKLVITDNPGQEIDHIQYGFSVIPTEHGVPEPAAWALMLTGFAGLGAMLRRRRAAQTLQGV